MNRGGQVNSPRHGYRYLVGSTVSVENRSTSFQEMGGGEVNRRVGRPESPQRIDQTGGGGICRCRPDAFLQFQAEHRQLRREYGIGRLRSFGSSMNDLYRLVSGFGSMKSRIVATSDW